MKNMFDAPFEWEEIGYSSCPAKIVRTIATKFPQEIRVLEIGTAYGKQLPSFAPFCERVVCVDAMYDWVPAIGRTTPHDPKKVDKAKIDEWNRNVEPFREKTRLFVGNSFDMHRDLELRSAASGSNVIVVDGCHHPAEAVRDDYLNFFPLMALPHYAVFDDMQFGDCERGLKMSLEWLSSEGLLFAVSPEATKSGIRGKAVYVWRA